MSTMNKPTDEELTPDSAMDEDDGLKIVLPKIFRDKRWAEKWGKLQTEIDEFQGRVVFDFTACRWIDPLPLMSVLLEIAQVQYKGQKVVVRLPKPDKKWLFVV